MNSMCTHSRALTELLLYFYVALEDVVYIGRNSLLELR